jgi:GWxTD domain-containing protein
VPVDIDDSGAIIERRYLVVVLILLALSQLDVNVYRFENGYVEVWYQVPVSSLVDAHHSRARADAFYDVYSYRFHIKNVDGSDSAYFEGEKTVISGGEVTDEMIVDYFPLNLYSGRFEYILHITAAGGKMEGGGTIEIVPDDGPLSCSDVMTGRFGHDAFSFHDIPFLPAIDVEFTDREELFSYLEIYGLVPDSLFYEVVYRLLDAEGTVLLEEGRKGLKYAYIQVDTHSVDLSRLAAGRYDYSINIEDPSSHSSVTRLASFSLRMVGGYASHDLYGEIEYFITVKEYNEFMKLTESQKDIYLKDFWLRHDYIDLQNRVMEADRRFSVGKLLGRDSERGRLYILQGPPDEIETVPIATWSRPFEVWYYYGRNDYLFCDIKSDNNPRLIRVLKPGEIAQIIQTGFRDGTREEDWLSDIAPGTYDWHKNLENVE